MVSRELEDAAMLATVHGLFGARARSAPNAIAVICAGSAPLTYAALDSLSTRLARRMSLEGVREGVRVGLVCQRSPETIAAILAVLKLGAVFVPFDVTYPRAHVAAMLEDAEPALMISDRSGDALASQLCGTVRHLTLDTLVQGAARESDHALQARGIASDTAYVMFTSGSHGRPKGVMVRHRGIVRLVRDQSYARFEPESVMLHIAPLAFDASTFELWGALLNGGALAVLRSPTPSLAEIGDTIRDCNVTMALLVSGLFHVMVDQRVQDLSPLRTLVVGGDVLSPEHVRRAQSALPDCQIINAYGPTENTVATCCFCIPRGGWGDGPVPIGTPLRGTSVHVLDAELRPVEAGCVGQLATGGEGVAAGYLRRDDLTAERFVPDPFGDGGDAKLYLTGDLVRWRADGLLEFLGRQDRQLKIDGKRVELDEIEAALRKLPGVGDAAVIQREDTPGMRRLVAYVAWPDGATRDDASAACAAALPELVPRHMVPSSFVILTRLPLNPQGKVDRRNLPPLESSPRLSTVGDHGDLTATERELMHAWSEVLGVNLEDATLNFFDMGATSLHLVRIHEILSRRWRDAELMKFFERPSVRALARYLDELSSPARRDSGAAARERAERQAAAMRRRRGSDARGR
jgi:amino acid adenylation domain-containing protein